MGDTIATTCRDQLADDIGAFRRALIPEVLITLTRTFRDGDFSLVAPSTDPGWTPLFLTAGGLVMEMGGANSHGAVVAREYGIPAVVGVADAVSRISTGDRITVDGSAGTITVTTSEPA